MRFINVALISKLIKSGKKNITTKDINTFLALIEENKEDIIKIIGFESIEIPEIKDMRKSNLG